MKIKSTYHYLNLVLTDIQQQCLRSPAFALFNHNKTKAFHSENAVRIKLLQDGMKLIRDKYCKMDENGNPLIENGNVVFEDDAAKESFVKEWTEFGAKEFEINM